MKISGPNEARIVKKEASGNGVTITYLPVTPGEYNVDIKCKGKHIYGSPFISKVTGMNLDVPCVLLLCRPVKRLERLLAPVSAFENLYLL